MKKILALLVLISLAFGSQAFAVVLNPTADAFAISWMPTYNNGINGVYLSAGFNYSIPGEMRSFLKFDLSGMPNIGSAILSLYNTTTTAASTISVYSTSNAWTETGVNWNNMPAVIGSPLNVSVGPAAGFYSWDLTSLAQAAAGHEFSIELLGTGSGRSFYSAEASPASNRARLEVTAPVMPEPSSIALLSMGLAGLATRKLRKKAA